MTLPAGDAKYDIHGDTTQLQQALQDAENQMKETGGSWMDTAGKVGKGMTIAGGAIVGALGLAVRSFANTGDELDKMAIRVGVGVEELSALEFAASQSGVEMSTLGRGLRNMNENLASFIEEGEGSSETLEQLGISVEELKDMKPEEQMRRIATGLQGVSTHGARASLAADIFGQKAGPEMLPLLQMGGAGIDELTDRARELGLTWDEDATTAAADFNDALDELWRVVERLWQEIGAELIPQIQQFVERAVEALMWVREWADENPVLMRTIIKVAAAVGTFMFVVGPLILKLKALAIALAVVQGLMGPKGWLALAGAAGAIGGALLLVQSIPDVDPQAAEGMSASELASQAGIEGFARGGFGRGWALVGEDGPEIVNLGREGGRVIDAASTSDVLTPRPKGDMYIDLKGSFVRSRRAIEGLGNEMWDWMDEFRSGGLGGEMMGVS